jgi:hypothetical protein
MVLRGACKWMRVRQMNFEILPGLPPYGPRAVSFTERGDQEFREGLVIRFHPENSDPWIGNFLGGETNCTTVLDHPNETDVIVVANGNAFVIDLEKRAIRDRIGGDITAVIPSPALGLVIFQGFVDFTAVRANGTGWVSPRISWDGFRNIKVHESVLSGEAWAPSIKDIWMPFTLDLLTGQCTDGIYGNDMARAVRVGP